MSEEKKEKGLLTQQQFTAVFGYEAGQLQRFIRFNMPVERRGQNKYFDLVQVGNWLRSYWAVGYMDLNEVATMFGVEPRTVTKFVNDFGMPKSATGFYKRNDVVQWREKYLSGKIKTLQQGGTDGVSASTKLKQAQARRQELRLAKESGRLVEIDKVKPVFEKIYSLISQRRKLFSKRTNPQLDGIDSFGEREAILNKNIDELFTDIYDSGIRELARLQELSDGNENVTQDPASAAPHARKRTRRRASNSKRRIGKRTRKV